MATIRKKGNKWEVAVAKKGTRKSKTFFTKAESNAWATRIEADLESGERGVIPNKTFGDLMEKYAEEVSPKNKGHKWELKRINALRNDALWCIKLEDLDSPHIAQWRDRRLKTVKAGTVLREWNMLSPACNIAVKEWHWLRHNPMSDVKRPKEPAPRTRTWTQDEIETMQQTMGDDVKTISGRVYWAFLFALETAMREGEIAAITPKKVKLEERICKVTEGKTRAAIREVPLSTKAVTILKKVGCHFGVTADQISVNFYNRRIQAGILDATFHDTRHNAITMLSKKFEVLALARAVGHTKIQQLMVYYNPKAADLALLLD